MNNNNNGSFALSSQSDVFLAKESIIWNVTSVDNKTISLYTMFFGIGLLVSERNVILYSADTFCITLQSAQDYICIFDYSYESPMMTFTISVPTRDIHTSVFTHTSSVFLDYWRPQEHLNRIHTKTGETYYIHVKNYPGGN